MFTFTYGPLFQVRAHKLAVAAGALVADITSSRFSHSLSDDISNDVNMSDHIISLEHREIVSQSTIPVITSYQTAVVVFSVASAFVISILVVTALYRKKACSNADSLKTTVLAQRFLSQTAPIYVVSLPLNGKPKTSKETAQDN
jgi:hypothetical protein